MNESPISQVPYERLKWGVTWGAAYGVVLCLWSVAVFAFLGAGPFIERGLSLSLVLILFALGGIAGGAMVGILLPVAVYPGGTILLAAVAVLPIGIGTLGSLHGFGLTTLITAAAGALFLAVPLGLLFRKRFQREIGRAKRQRDDRA